MDEGIRIRQNVAATGYPREVTDDDCRSTNSLLLPGFRSFCSMSTKVVRPGEMGTLVQLEHTTQELGLDLAPHCARRGSFGGAGARNTALGGRLLGLDGDSHNGVGPVTAVPGRLAETLRRWNAIW